MPRLNFKTTGKRYIYVSHYLLYAYKFLLVLPRLVLKVKVSISKRYIINVTARTQKSCNESTFGILQQRQNEALWLIIYGISNNSLT